ncbi:Acyltransferase family protein [Rubripirellula amarantea]|uniref:Acyltransferase family protein n=1 Tax=Rubripirellula amarantea TaxID=2527999 RepID=A0A5C5WM97_9BACT|nr:acyltransferase [Rubripirellula amarantea]TWT51221.1 Acyltransferase family protein [Rubripirellula amarantea]
MDQSVAPPRERRTKLNTLQVLRAVAALAVLVFHASDISRVLGFTDGPHPVLLHLGPLGVNLFFVLSGFIIYYVHGKDIGIADRARNYTWRRFSRVWPLYAFITLANTVAELAVGGPFEGGRILSSLLFLDAKPVVNVGWTLVHEAFFYAMFGAAIVGGRKFAASLVVGFCALAIFAQLSSDETDSLYHWVFSAQKWYFVTGLGLACVFANQLQLGDAKASKRFGIGLFAALFVCSIIALPFGSLATRMGWHLMVALAIAACVGLLVFCETRFNLWLPRSLVYIGNASYSLYLVHSSVQYHLMKIASKISPALTSDHLLFTLVVVSFVAILAGILCYELVEKRLMKWFR